MVLMISTAGLVYELSMAAVASYVLGDSVRQFSLIIGVYLSALGGGAYLSRFIEGRLALRFVDIELATALLGGLSAPLLFVAFSYTGAFSLILYATVISVGVLVGLELPLLIRILRSKLAFNELIAKSLTFDYAGALVGSVGFSLVLLPTLGLMRSSLVCGLLNALVGLWSTWILRGETEHDRRAMASARVRAVVVCALLFAALLSAERLLALSEAHLYSGNVVVREQSRYQRIVIAERGEHFSLYLNGNLQFASVDEHRYHEALVHPALALTARPRRVFVGGGGDGLAVREILKWSAVELVSLVDLDPAMTRLAREHSALSRANGRALEDSRVTVTNRDAFIELSESSDAWDVIVLDFPDPSNFSLGKLYSVELYRAARRRLAPGGTLVVQATSPLFARRSFWCIEQSLRAAGLGTLPYRVFVPSFGEWGFILAKPGVLTPPESLPELPLRFLDAHTLAALFEFPPDMQPLAVRPNRLDTQALVGYYLDEWSRWN